MDTSELVKRTRVHAYAPEFKARVLAECRQPGASVAKVALANGLNANMIHTWRRQSLGASATAGPADGEFIPLALPDTSAETRAAAIRIELRRGATTMTITWPAAAAEDCAAWMRELLR